MRARKLYILQHFSLSKTDCVNYRKVYIPTTPQLYNLYILTPSPSLSPPYPSNHALSPPNDVLTPSPKTAKFLFPKPHIFFSP
jgi:hypothetical protein